MKVKHPLARVKGRCKTKPVKKPPRNNQMVDKKKIN
jgi:hypothetical protein